MNWRPSVSSSRYESPEGVARENAAALAVDDADVVPRVPRRIEAQQLAAGEVEAQFVRRFDDARGVDRQHLAVQAAHFGRAIDGGGAGHQLGGIGHVPRAARVHHEAGVGEGAHHRAGAAGVVEMDVRQDHVIDALRRQIERGQRPLDRAQRFVVAGIDDRGAAFSDDRWEWLPQRRTNVAGIEGIDESPRVPWRPDGLSQAAMAACSASCR